MSETISTSGPGRLSSGRHPVNIGHLVMGLAFLGLVVVWAVVQSEIIDEDNIRWLLPVPWVLAGGVGLVASVLAGRRQAVNQPTHQVGWTQPSGGTEHPDDEPLS